MNQLSRTDWYIVDSLVVCWTIISVSPQRERCFDDSRFRPYLEKLLIIQSDLLIHPEAISGFLVKSSFRPVLGENHSCLE
jgi:hypothetical protein